MSGVWPMLRQATAPAHRQLERVPVLARLFADDLSRDELAGVLAGMARVHLALEPVLAASAAAAAVGYRPRLELLRAGLDLLGHPLPPPHEADLAPLALARPARAWGALYVVEGSILGGQVIRRQLLARFGPDIAAAIAFFTPYGDQCAAQWARCRAGLEENLRDPAMAEDAVAAAALTFGLFSTVLSSMHTNGG